METVDLANQAAAAATLALERYLHTDAWLYSVY